MTDEKRGYCSHHASVDGTYGKCRLGNIWIVNGDECDNYSESVTTVSSDTSESKVYESISSNSEPYCVF